MRRSLIFLIVGALIIIAAFVVWFYLPYSDIIKTIGGNVVQKTSREATCRDSQKNVFLQDACYTDGKTYLYIRNNWEDRKDLSIKITDSDNTRVVDISKGRTTSLVVLEGEYSFIELEKIFDGSSCGDVETQVIESCAPDFSPEVLPASPKISVESNLAGGGGASGASGGISGNVVSGDDEEETEESQEFSFGLVYGPGVAMDSLANTHAGSPDGIFILPSFGFTAEQTGNFVSLRFHHAGGTGYASGTGGIAQVEIYENDPETNTPVGLSLAIGNIPPTNATIIQEIFLDTPVSVVEGQIYHLVFRNTDPNPTVNYFSVDNVYLKNPDNETFIFPKYYPSKLFHMYKTDGDWIRRHDFLPILEIAYDNGFHQGMSYDEIQYGDGVPGEIRGSEKIVREVIHFSEGDRLVSGVGVRVLKTSDTSSPLIATILNSTGSPIASASINASSVATGPTPPASCGCTHCDCEWNLLGSKAKWTQGNFSENVVLNEGSKYYLQFSSDEGTYWMWSMRHFVDLPSGHFPEAPQSYNQYGFDLNTAFTDGYAQKTIDGGTNWNYLGMYYTLAPINNLQFYLSLSDQEVECPEGSEEEYCLGKTIITGKVVAIEEISPRDPQTNLVILMLIVMTLIAILELERRKRLYRKERYSSRY